MLPGSRFRRRLLSAVFVAGSVLLLSVPPAMLPPGARWKALFLAPAFLMLGSLGLVYPKSVPDLRPAAGVLGAVAEAGSPAFMLGGCVFAVGLGIGAWLAFFR